MGNYSRIVRIAIGLGLVLRILDSSPMQQTCTKEKKKSGEKEEKGDNLKQRVHAQVSMHMCINPDVVIYSNWLSQVFKAMNSEG